MKSFSIIFLLNQYKFYSNNFMKFFDTKLKIKLIKPYTFKDLEGLRNI